MSLSRQENPRTGQDRRDGAKRSGAKRSVRLLCSPSHHAPILPAASHRSSPRAASSGEKGSVKVIPEAFECVWCEAIGRECAESVVMVTPRSSRARIARVGAVRRRWWPTPVSHERTQTPQNNLSCGAPGFPAATSDSVMTSDGGSADAVRPTRAPPAPE